MCSSLQGKLKGGGSWEASMEWGRGKAGGGTALPRAQGHLRWKVPLGMWAGPQEWREELEEESVNTQIKVAFKSITNTCMLLAQIKCRLHSFTFICSILQGLCIKISVTGGKVQKIIPGKQISSRKGVRTWKIHEVTETLWGVLNSYQHM